MRKPMVAANWKMNGLCHSARDLIEAIKHEQRHYQAVDMVIFPAFVHLLLIQQLINATNINVGGQNLYLGNHGAFTGEISGPMLADLGCRYVLVGHSERRTIFHEDDELIANKFQAALDAGLQPILCVGETLQQRDHHQTNAVIRKQLETVITKIGIGAFQQAVIAYEPVWSIGSGSTATPEQIQTVHAYIRGLMVEYASEVGEKLRILYGGSLTPEDAANVFAMPDVDGGLVGGASLEAKSFLAIYREAARKHTTEGN